MADWKEPEPPPGWKPDWTFTLVGIAFIIALRLIFF